MIQRGRAVIPAKIFKSISKYYTNEGRGRRISPLERDKKARSRGKGGGEWNISTWVSRERKNIGFVVGLKPKRRKIGGAAAAGGRRTGDEFGPFRRM